MKGRIHSLESFGTVDGPGVRFVVFVQGCPMRCAYCHNPDTWPMEGGTLMEPEEIFEQYRRNEGFYKGGGITVTGGEPLMQIDFLIDLFTIAKAHNVHTCIDTSGIAYRPDANPDWLARLDHLMALTDLVEIGRYTTVELYNGENLYDFAETYQTDPESLQKLNPDTIIEVNDSYAITSDTIVIPTFAPYDYNANKAK